MLVPCRENLLHLIVDTLLIYDITSLHGVHRISHATEYFLIIITSVIVRNYELKQ